MLLVHNLLDTVEGFWFFVHSEPHWVLLRQFHAKHLIRSAISCFLERLKWLPCTFNLVSVAIWSTLLALKPWTHVNAWISTFLLIDFAICIVIGVQTKLGGWTRNRESVPSLPPTDLRVTTCLDSLWYVPRHYLLFWSLLPQHEDFSFSTRSWLTLARVEASVYPLSLLLFDIKYQVFVQFATLIFALIVPLDGLPAIEISLGRGRVIHVSYFERTTWSTFARRIVRSVEVIWFKSESGPVQVVPVLDIW